MPAKIFTDMLTAAEASKIDARQKSSAAWFKAKAREVGKVNTHELLSSSKDRFRQSMQPGTMYMFFYDPKHKETLPYYDQFPLIFPLAIEKDSILGINLHYLQPALRAKLLDALNVYLSNDKMNAQTKLNMSYQLLKSASKFNLVKPCIKRYLKTHVRSRFVKVNSNEWVFTVTLPLESFEKANKRAVWAESRKIAGL